MSQTEAEREVQMMDPFTRIIQINANRSHYRRASQKIVALAPDRLDGRDVNVILSHLHDEVVEAYWVLLEYFAERERSTVARVQAALEAER